jgi:hypothetical protein
VRALAADWPHAFQGGNPAVWLGKILTGVGLVRPGWTRRVTSTSGRQTRLYRIIDVPEHAGADSAVDEPGASGGEMQDPAHPMDALEATDAGSDGESVADTANGVLPQHDVVSRTR